MSLDHADPRLRQRAAHLVSTKVVESADGCWEWTGAKQGAGYGTVNVMVTKPGKTRPVRSNTTAHRFFYAALVGNIPTGDTIHHKCHNRLCVNPDHLEAISQRENAAEMFERRALHASIDHAEDTMTQMADALTDAYRQDHYEDS